MQSIGWSQVYRLCRDAEVGLKGEGRRFPDRVIVLVLLWAAWNQKPISWACVRSNWPVWMQRLLKRAPSSTTMSRRLRRDAVAAFLDRVLDLAQGPTRSALLRFVDATALEVRNHSKDPHAGYGWGSGRKAKGYKLHVVLEAGGRIDAWRLSPMHASESAIASRMLRGIDDLAYVIADGAYDSSRLHDIVTQRGGQLVVPRERNRRGRRPTPKRYQAPGRLRSIEILEGPYPAFGADLLRARGQIERFFGHADGHAHGLGELPAWVRTHQRVKRWVHAKLIINALRINTLASRNTA